MVVIIVEKGLERGTVHRTLKVARVCPHYSTFVSCSVTNVVRQEHSSCLLLFALFDSIADHMPPNVIAHGRGWAKAVVASGEANSFLARLRSTIPFLPFSPKVVHQRLYPQCTDCSKLQSAALRHGKRGPLVFHFKRGVPEVRVGTVWISLRGEVIASCIFDCIQPSRAS